jgi:hypothetical protein
VNLSNAIYNVKYSKEEFERKKAEILKDYESIEKAKKEFEELKKNTIRKFADQTKCHNVSGDYIHNCYDGVQLFDTYDAKNCSYMKDAEKPVDTVTADEELDEGEDYSDEEEEGDDAQHEEEGDDYDFGPSF